MWVKAIRKGWYGNERRRPGAEFEIEGLHELGAWMERLNKPGPKKKPQGANDVKHLPGIETGHPELG